MKRRRIQANFDRIKDVIIERIPIIQELRKENSEGILMKRKLILQALSKENPDKTKKIIIKHRYIPQKEDLDKTKEAHLKHRPIIQALIKQNPDKIKEVLMNPAADLRPFGEYDKPKKHRYGSHNEQISLLVIAFKRCNKEIFNLLLNDFRIHNSFYEIEFALYYFSILKEKEVGSEYVTSILNKGNKRAISYSLKRDQDGYLTKMYKPTHRNDFINEILEV